MQLGIDAGNKYVKICGPGGCSQFSSLIGEYRERNFDTKYGPDDMVVEYEGVKRFAGTIVQFECEHGGSRKGDSKAHEDAKLRILIAVHRTISKPVEEVNLVVGQPVSTHTPEEKMKIRNMLIGRHEMVINGDKKVFIIRAVEIGAEGVIASLSDPHPGLIRYIDVGSGTVNYGTTFNMKKVDRDSWTERSGADTVRNTDPETFVRRVCTIALDRWKETDEVRLLGGKAEEFLPYVQSYFPRAQLLNPRFISPDNVTVKVNTTYGNAVGCYEAAKRVFK